MSLQKWAEYGWLKAEPTSRDEIKSLLTIVSRDLRDANVTAISEDRRLEAAFNAARTAASVALRASGYRTSTQLGHHVKTTATLANVTKEVQSLFTLAHTQFALTNSLLQYVLTCTIEPHEEVLPAARARARLRYAKILRHAAQEVATRNKATLEKVLTHGKQE